MGLPDNADSVASEVVVEYEVSISLSEVEVKDIVDVSEPLMYRISLRFNDSVATLVVLLEE